jgi:hypothetical protein
MRLNAICTAVLLMAAFPAAASAAPPLFTPPVAVAGGAPVLATGGPRSGGGGNPDAVDVVLGRNGEATVAWLGPFDGDSQPVFVAERPAGGGAFGPKTELGADASYQVALARNDTGVRAVAWSGKLAIAPAGGGFGVPETIPVPPRAPPTRTDIEDVRWFAASSVAVAADGAAVVAYTDRDVRADNMRAVTVVRRPDGSWTEPQVLDDYAGDPHVVADASGGVHVIWATAPRTTTDGFRLYVADAGPDGHFGAPRLVSNPDWRSEGSLVANRRGDLLVSWKADAAGPVIGATFRPAGGEWQQPEVLYGGIPYGQWATGALDDRGDAAVTWTNGDAFARSHPAGQPWGPTSTTFMRQGGLSPYQLALDARGTGLVLSAACRSEGTEDTIAATVLPRGGSLEPVVSVSPGVDPVSQPAVATDVLGNGLVVWLRGPRNEQSTVFAAGYSATPPDVSGFAAKRSAFRFKVSEPARVTITVKGGHRRAVQRARVRRGGSTLAFARGVRSLLKHHGRYRATLLARDPGPRASKPRTIALTR